MITQDANITTGDAANVDVTADSGGITMADGTVTSIGIGAVTYNATADIAISRINSDDITGDVNVTSSLGAITDNLTGDGVGFENFIGNVVQLMAATGIGGVGAAAIDTETDFLVAVVTAAGDIYLAETDLVALTSTTVDGSINLTANGMISADFVSAGGGAGDSVFLSTTTGGILASGIVAADSLTLNADAGDVTITTVAAIAGDVDIDATAGDVLIDQIFADSAGAVVDINAGGSVLDRISDASVNISAVAGNVIINAGVDIGEAGTDVLKGVASDPLEIDSAMMRLAAGGIIAVHQTTSTIVSLLNGDTIFISSNGDIDLSAATITATNVALLAPNGTITLPLATSISVSDDFRIEADDVDVVSGTIDLDATRIVFKSGQSEVIKITAQQFDGETNGNLTVNSDSAALQLTDLDCDLTAIDVGSNVAVLNSTVAATVSQLLPSDGLQNSRILAGSLVLNGMGTYDLTNTENDTDVLAGLNTGSIAFKDIDDVTIDIVVAPASGTVSGLTSGNSDVLLDVGQHADDQSSTERRCCRSATAKRRDDPANLNWNHHGERTGHSTAGGKWRDSTGSHKRRQRPGRRKQRHQRSRHVLGRRWTDHR